MSIRTVPVGNRGLRVLASALLLSTGCLAQPGGGGAEKPGNGFHLDSVSGFFGYNSMPVLGEVGSTPSISDRLEKGGSVRTGFTWLAPGWNFAATYSLNLVSTPQYPISNGIGHTLGMAVSHNITPRLKFHATLTGQYSNVAQYLFLPSRTALAASVPGSFDEILQAIPSAREQADAPGALVGVPSLIDGPARLLLGDHLLTVGFETGVTYSVSPRFNVSASFRGQRMQGIQTDNAPIPGSSQALISRTTSGGVTLDATYSLSPSSTLGFDLGSTRLISPQEDAFTQTASLTYGRTIGKNWFASVSGGAGDIKQVSGTAILPRGVLGIAGGSLGYRLQSNRWLVSYNTSLSDPYGLGTQRSQAITGAWNYARPFSHWNFSLGGGRQMFSSTGGVQGDLNGWIGQATIRRELGRTVSLEFAGTYANSRTTLAGLINGTTQRAARLSVVWTPHQIAWIAQ